jgi:FkbM family methyltransferase
MKSDSTIEPAPLKQMAQALLKQIGLYQRLRSSCIYDLYWTFANPQWLANRAREIRFYRAVLEGFKKGNVIFDIGANDGYKTDIFLRIGAKVIAVEPDEINQDVLKEKFIKSRFFPKPVIVVSNAVSDRVGVTTMWIDAPGSALNTLNPKWVDTLRNDETHAGMRLNFAEEKKVQTTTLEKLIASYGIPFYIKIDVEGHELNVLRGLKQLVRYISFEVNLPEFKEEGLECIRILNQITTAGEFNYVADYDEGLIFKQWVPAAEFIHAFEQCKKSAIEVFWRFIG